VSYSAYDVLGSMGRSMDTRTVTAALAYLERSMAYKALTNGLNPGGSTASQLCI
jgi:hypothetical protein